MFLINLNAEIVACILFRKSRHKPNLESTSKYGFSLHLGGKDGGVLSMRVQVILDSSFARPGSAPIWGGKKVEFRDWTIRDYVVAFLRDSIGVFPVRELKSIIRIIDPVGEKSITSCSSWSKISGSKYLELHGDTYIP